MALNPASIRGRKKISQSLAIGPQSLFVLGPARVVVEGATRHPLAARASKSDTFTASTDSSIEPSAGVDDISSNRGSFASLADTVSQQHKLDHGPSPPHSAQGSSSKGSIISRTAPARPWTHPSSRPSPRSWPSSASMSCASNSPTWGRREGKRQNRPPDVPRGLARTDKPQSKESTAPSSEVT